MPAHNPEAHLTAFLPSHVQPATKSCFLAFYMQPRSDHFLPPRMLPPWSPRAFSHHNTRLRPLRQESDLSIPVQKSLMVSHLRKEFQHSFCLGGQHPWLSHSLSLSSLLPVTHWPPCQGLCTLLVLLECSSLAYG